MKRKFLIDTDTASDDAVALIMALRNQSVEVVAITVVAGNVPVDQGVQNALYTVELTGCSCPVYRGAERPLCRELQDAAFFHGRDGLGDRGYPAPRRSAAKGVADEVLIREIGNHPGLTLVTLGPLTNLALALRKAPEIASQVGRCVVMGGAACTVGNVTPAAEYNIWVDPEAARIVFESGLPIQMVGWELCRGEANLSPEEVHNIQDLDNPLGHFAIDCNRTALRANRAQSGDPGLALPDPVAMSIALDPHVCTRSSTHYVQIETSSDLTRGMTVVDALGVAPDSRNREAWSHLLGAGPNALVCWEIDIAAFKQSLIRALSP